MIDLNFTLIIAGMVVVILLANSGNNIGLIKKMLHK